MTSGEATKQRTEGDLERIEDNPVFQAVARFGYGIAGLLQLLIGIIAIGVALQRSGSEADQSGAFSDLAKAPGGALLLWVGAIGAFALVLWLVVAGAIRHGVDRRETWKHRLRDWGRALLYLVIGIAAVRFALGSSSSSAHESQKGSATLLSLPGGPVLLTLVGLGTLAGGVWLVYSGLRKKFLKLLVVPAGSAGRVTVLLGQVGYVARGVAIGVVGILFVVAAFTADPKKASGLDGALKSFAELPFGRVVLIVIGLGWIASAVFSFVLAKRARLT
jgi:hypothetical protein